MKNWCIIRIRNGEIDNKHTVKNIFDELKDGKYLVEIGQHNKRSNQANRYYHGICIPLVQAAIKNLGTDLTHEETHEFLKARFNYSDVVNTQTGEAVQVPRSTTILNKEAFSEYIEKIQVFSLEFLNLHLPYPGEALKIEYD